MKDSELNQILKSVPPPERPEEFWTEFPGRTMREIHARERIADVRSSQRARARFPGMVRDWVGAFGFKAALAMALAIICLFIIFAPGLRPGAQPQAGDSQFARVKQYFREIEPLFPNQLQAIVFDDKDTELVLADAANVPTSTPLYLKICGPKGCKRFVTFSGQQIRVNGDLCDVLVDRKGNILVVGENLVWSSSYPAGKTGSYQIEARSLGTT
jgi:hypothetical protein